MVVGGSIFQPPYLRRRSEDPPAPPFWLLKGTGGRGRPVSETRLILIRQGAGFLAPCSAPGLLHCCRRQALHRRGTWCSPSLVLCPGPQAESWRLSCRTGVGCEGEVAASLCVSAAARCPRERRGSR